MAMKDDPDRTELARPAVPKILGRYEIQEKLGGGAMGDVYAAHDPLIHRDVVLKTVQRGLLGGKKDAEEMLDRFRRECKLLGACSHPNVVAMYDAGEDEPTGTMFLVMERVEGIDLQSLQKGAGKLPPEQVQEIALGLARALEAAHARGIVHRDVKPSNILLAVDGTVKLTDIGIARTAGDQITREGTVVGTPTYLAPEQLVGNAPLDGRADLFSLGIVLYQLLSGRHPFQGKDVAETCARLLHDEPVPIRDAVPETPPVLAATIARLLAKRASDRPRSATEVIAALLGERTEDASTLTLEKPVARSGLRVPLVVAAIVLPAALALGWGISSIYRGARGLFAPPVAKSAAPTPATPTLVEVPGPAPTDRRPLPPKPEDAASRARREREFRRMEQEYRDFQEKRTPAP
ncbi:MAG: protein kinase [Acidobacteriota bacterium]